MPRSKSRKPHHQQFHSPAAKNEPQKNKVVIVSTIFLALLGIGIALFASFNFFVLLLGALVGGVCGYFFGKQIEKSFSNK